MFKDTKALVKQLADTAQEPLHTFDEVIKAKPEVLVALAALHVIPIALAIVGTTEIITTHQQLKMEKERTKQVKLRANLGCGHHRHHPHHGPDGHRPHGPRAPRLLAEAAEV
ncbi:hypothetical protein [Lacticaseibacillus daqingensis]|uniref:hypothetical protein n=1 Tax=Lacticaseibacillus daqingensis TaxID=2486014 RepID=UPI000F77A2CA|nr:hypothetical protein [Lacticaseibacillus daqingensis]